jgi:hypothetical protein
VPQHALANPPRVVGGARPIGTLIVVVCAAILFGAFAMGLIALASAGPHIMGWALLLMLAVAGLGASFLALMLLIGAFVLVRDVVAPERVERSGANLRILRRDGILMRREALIPFADIDSVVRLSTDRQGISAIGLRHRSGRALQVIECAHDDVESLSENISALLATNVSAYR